MNICRKCGVELTDGNWHPSHIKSGDCICKECHNTRSRKRHYNQRGSKPMSENKKCTQFLGVHIAERVLSHVFKDVERMPNNHKGFDVRCNGGYLIDIKSACKQVEEKRRGRWVFNINKNTIADYFLCLAFDNREDLNPLHIWLIPGKDVNDKTGISIAESKLDKWDCYRVDKMKEIIIHCDSLKQTRR